MLCNIRNGSRSDGNDRAGFVQTGLNRFHLLCVRVNDPVFVSLEDELFHRVARPGEQRLYLFLQLFAFAENDRLVHDRNHSVSGPDAQGLQRVGKPLDGVPADDHVLQFYFWNLIVVRPAFNPLIQILHIANVVLEYGRH